MNSISTRARCFLARRNAFRHAGIIMSIPICSFLLWMKNGNVKMFLFLFSLALSLLTESRAVSERLYMDASMYKWNSFAVDCSLRERALIMCIGKEPLGFQFLSMAFASREMLWFISHDEISRNTLVL